MGSFERMEGNWARVEAVAASREQLFVVDNTILYRVAQTGAYEPLTNRWHPRAMAALGDALYLFATDDNLYKVSQADGTFTQLTRGWREIRGATTTRDGLYVATAQSIFQLDPDTGEELKLPQRWDVKLLVGMGTFLFAFETDGTLRRLDTRDGTYVTLPGNWPNVTAAAAAQDALFAIDNTVLYRIDPRTGATARLDNRFHTQHLAVVGSHLFSFENGELFRVTP